MEPSEQKDVPPDFSELDKLHTFVSSFLGRVEKVERKVNLDNNIGAMPEEDTKSKMAELREMVQNVENRIQDASDDLSQPENLHKHVDVFHNYYIWVNREITRISNHLGEYGYHPLDEHVNISSDMCEIWSKGLTVQKYKNNSDVLSASGKNLQPHSIQVQQDGGPTSIEDEDSAIDDVDVSCDVAFRRDDGGVIKPPETPKKVEETSVTAKFVTVHKLSPQQEYEQTITNFKTFFQGTPERSLTYGNNTSFMSSNSELVYTSPNEPHCGASSVEQGNTSWMAIQQETSSGKLNLCSLLNTRDKWEEPDVINDTGPPGGGGCLEEPIALCTEQEYEMLPEKISLSLQQVNAMIVSLNKVQRETPNEPLNFSPGDNEQKILTHLKRIKFEIKGSRIGYYPISTTSQPT